MGKTKTKTLTKNISRTLLLVCAFALISAGSMSLFNVNTPEVKADRCITEVCKQAAAAEQAAMQKATNATTAANTLAGEVKRIDDQIAMYEASIRAQAALANDFQIKIKKNQQRLARERAALAKVLSDAHFEGQPEAIMILAKSNSISDYVEEQSRADTVKEQVNRSAQIVKKTKEELEEQKKEVDRAIANQKLQRDAANNERAKRERLINEYRDKADQYSSDAAKARAIRIANTNRDIQTHSGGGTIVAGGVNTYPYANRCPRENLLFSNGWGYGCQCVSYTGWKAYERWGASISYWGDAKNWARKARSLGYRVDYTPSVHTVAVNESGTYGHVMWVERVNGNGTIDISEYNYKEGDYTYRTGVPASGLQFIHFN